jgi:hypothetical protein
MILLSSRSIQTYFNQKGQMLVAISQNMDTLREQNKQNSEILTAFGTASTGSPDEALEKLLDNAASHIANPYMRSGFKKALEITIRQAQESFEQGQILRRDAEARDISFSPRLKLANRQWPLLTTNSSRTAKSLFGDITIQTKTYKTTIERENGHGMRMRRTRKKRHQSGFVCLAGIANASSPQPLPLSHLHQKLTRTRGSHPCC